tara:strand:- start:726 stop:1262 length:537 start_codon:yes stop_codon:yes gene_type:complete
MLDAKFFIRIGAKVRDRYREHIFGSDQSLNYIKPAKDINGKKFKGYSTNGSKWVTINVNKSFKKNAPKEGYSYKKAKEGDMFKRQSSSFKDSTNPVLSGDLLRDYSLIKTMSNGFQIGWTTFGARVEHLRKMGRVLTTSAKPLPDKVFKYLTTEANKYIKKGSDKLIPKKTTIHKIGK